ncbi:MAG: endonuclease/exonuclease/phosphatase family protein [Candidatus Paceibacterota bacterium]|jgi:endonuclease/exonuclease/phosphatase family metal-dependent hydrolase
MKLITLNAWGGRVREPLEKFVDHHRDADTLCLQEVYRDRYESPDNIDRSKANFNLYQDLQKRLDGHNHEFCQMLGGIYGLATFTNAGVEVIERGETLVARGNWHETLDLKNRDLNRKLMWFEARIRGKMVLVVNTHLTHRPEGKMDSEKRINQSKIIVEFLRMFDCSKILCGDFNLLPDTESIRAIEASGMRNLVKEYGVESTRTELYKKPLRFADYIFVSPDVKVNDFRVLPDVVSDHSPLYLDFEV